jgi:hypothetical protein
MSYRALPRPRPPKPPIATPDLLVSIAALVMTVLLGVGAAALGLFSLAFLDYCPPESCSADHAVDAVGIALLLAGVVGVTGLTVTIIQLTRRKPGWPFAISTFVVCGILCSIGGVGYAVAVGA